MKLFKIYDNIMMKCLRRINYVNFLRKNGAVIGEGCEIYSTASFGSEPYLITV